MLPHPSVLPGAPFMIEFTSHANSAVLLTPQALISSHCASDVQHRECLLCLPGLIWTVQLDVLRSGLFQ